MLIASNLRLNVESPLHREVVFVWPVGSTIGSVCGNYNSGNSFWSIILLSSYSYLALAIRSNPWDDLFVMDLFEPPS